MYITMMGNEMTTKMKPFLYLSFDIETDGGNPLVNNMISIGFYGVTENLVNEFQYQANIYSLVGHVQDEDCMKFWQQNQSAWDATQINKKRFEVVMEDLSNKFTKLSKMYNLKFIAMPACFDWMFFKSYYEYAAKTLHTKFYNIGFKCICISSYFDAYCENKNIYGKDKESLKLQLMEHDKSKDHHAIENAKCQAKLFIKIRQIIGENEYM